MKKILTNTIFLATCVAFVFGIAACGGEERPENLRFNYTYTAERPVAEKPSTFGDGHYTNGIFIYDIPRLYQGYGFDAFTSFYEEEFSKISEDRFYFLDTTEHTYPNGFFPREDSGEIEFVDINEDPAIDEYRIVQDFSIYDDELGYPRYFGKRLDDSVGAYPPSSVSFHVVFLPTAVAEGELRFEFGKQEETSDFINIYIGEQCIGTLFRGSLGWDPDWIDVFVPEAWYKNFFEKNLIRG